MRGWNVSPIPKPCLRSAARGLLDRDISTYVYGSLKLLVVLVEWLQDQMPRDSRLLLE